MDSRGTDKADDLATEETPEDVAVLYSWANLPGAKYRDFSASRREYRAQLRRQAIEQVREEALLAQAEAEAAARVAEAAAHDATEAARRRKPGESEASVRQSLREAEQAARTAAAERVEAVRRAETAAIAEAAARREEREIAEAHASAQRQAARYADTENRRRGNGRTEPGGTELSDPEHGPAGRRSTEGPGTIPGKIMDPYTIYSNAHPAVGRAVVLNGRDSEPTMPLTPKTPQTDTVVPNESESPTPPQAFETERRPAAPVPAPAPVTPRRPQGYRPDDASGVRQIYRGPDYDVAPMEYRASEPATYSGRAEGRAAARSGSLHEVQWSEPHPVEASGPPSSLTGGQREQVERRRTEASRPEAAYGGRLESMAATSASEEPRTIWSVAAGDRAETSSARAGFTMDAVGGALTGMGSGGGQSDGPGAETQREETGGVRPVTPFSQALVPPEGTRGRRARDDFDYQQTPLNPWPARRGSAEGGVDAGAGTPARAASAPDPAGPAWLYAPPVSPVPLRQSSPPVTVQSSVADTLQHSRERVAARWFALKGVFEQPGQEQESTPIRQKETRTPVLAVFSLAGGVGKTSLVATVGRALSSMGEKVLLTDTTSHGLLPFYFGASELRQGTVRTFSPPSGSTDAPIYLVSYDVDQKAGDEQAQELLAEEIINNSRGTHRILLDLTVNSSWIVRRMSRMNPTILVPVAPDMNSVISLQTVERFFGGVNDGDGRPLQPFYVLNQFDTSLPLHLDVREVMRRQLGDRLLPFVIRRAPSVSEALAEGMTVVDYAPDAPVADDYVNLATWLRTIAAPATAGFRNVRWSER